MRGIRRWGSGLVCYAVAWLIAAPSLCAESHTDAWGQTEVDWGQIETAPSPANLEIWTGAQAFSHAWSLYTGVTAAPFAGLEQDGLRLRAAGGYGAYDYSGPRASGVHSQIVRFNGTTSFGDILIGYQKQVGPVIVKGFAGLSAADYELTPDDPETAIRGRGFGGKVALEGWWTISDLAWSSIDLAWGSLYDSYSARGRLGWRFMPALSVGLETGAAGNLECDIVRVGGFVRYEWSGGEISASSGFSNDKPFDGGQARVLAQSNAPFATLSWLMHF